MTTEATEPEKPAVARVKAEPDSRLEQLLAQYELLKPAADEAEARLKSVVDAIKAIAVQEGNDGRTTHISVDAPRLGIALDLSWIQSWRLDAKRMKAEEPVTYVRFAVMNGSWTLRRAKA